MTCASMIRPTQHYDPPLNPPHSLSNDTAPDTDPSLHSEVVGGIQTVELHNPGGAAAVVPDMPGEEDRVRIAGAAVGCHSRHDLHSHWEGDHHTGQGVLHSRRAAGRRTDQGVDAAAAVPNHRPAGEAGHNDHHHWSEATGSAGPRAMQIRNSLRSPRHRRPCSGETDLRPCDNRSRPAPPVRPRAPGGFGLNHPWHCGPVS